MKIVFMVFRPGTWQQLRRGPNNKDDEATRPQPLSFVRGVDLVCHLQYELACPQVI